jgi:tetratricopeptide (TPR) repeat protein
MRLFSLIFALMLLCSSVSDATSVPPGGIAPDFTLTSLKGSPVSLGEHKGNVVVIIYWRTGHKRSLLALKDGNDVFEAFKNKDVKIIGIIAESDDKAEAKAELSEKGINFPVLTDKDRHFYSAYGIRVYPTTLIIDKEGMLAQDLPSHTLTYKKLLKGYVKKALGEIDEAQLNEMMTTHLEKKDDATLEAERLYNLADKFTKSRMYDMAITTAQKSVNVKPDMAKSHILLGFLYLETDEADKAFGTFSKAVELDPRSKEAKTGLGGALVLQGKADEAIEVLKPAARANPYPQMTYYELGKAYELKGDKDKSIEMYKKAIEKVIHNKILPSSVVKCQ